MDIADSMLTDCSDTPVESQVQAPLTRLKYEELPFYSKQVRIALRNCGVINP
jgi:hypothetical protein